MMKSLFAILLMLSGFPAPLALWADNGSRTLAGGSFTAGTAVGQTIALKSATIAPGAATVTFVCPITAYGAGTYAINWSCTGGDLTIASADKSLSLEGSFGSASMTYTGSGGGRGGHTVYTYSFSGEFSGHVTVEGISELVFGQITQVVTTPGGLSGTIGWNSAYSPLLVADPTRPGLLSADNITGQNPGAYGSAGSGIGQFKAIAGLAQDASGRIYVSDSQLNRIVRINDLTGAGWTQIGNSGAGDLEFKSPANVTIDKAGKIWVADADNNRIVRFDDMTGRNWLTFGALGGGIHEFSAPNSIAFDSLGRIYVADKGNNRLVRFDDLTGKNWTSLTEITVSPYSYYLTSPVSIVIDPAGKVNVALSAGDVVRMDDIAGGHASIADFRGPIAAMSIDHSGSVYAGGSLPNGLAQAANALAVGYFSSSFGSRVVKPSAILALATTSPTPGVPFLNATSVNFGSANVGEPTSKVYVDLENLGAKPFTIESISSGPDFPVTDNCLPSLPGTGVCNIYLDMKPTKTGSLEEVLSVATNSIHPLLSGALRGSGTVPAAVLLPSALNFDPQKLTTVSGQQEVTLANTGTGPLKISSIAVSANFEQTNDCPSVLPSGNGCAVMVSYHPSASTAQSGKLTFTDEARPGGAQQIVTLSGTGSAATPAFTLSPESIQFPDQATNTTSNAQSITLTNNSGFTFALHAPILSPGFSGTTTCGEILLDKAHCVYTLRFTPVKAELITGTLSIPVTGRASLNVELSGTAVTTQGTSAIVASPSALAFNITSVGDNPTPFVRDNEQQRSAFRYPITQVVWRSRISPYRQ